MTISGSTQQEYQNFQKNGGSITFIIDGEDISQNKEFEQSENIIPQLTTGFEISPTTLIHTAELQAQIMLYGDDWSQIIAHVYTSGGKIIYKKMPGGKYEATCVTPTL